jgi:hypothetical protein
MAQSPKKRPQQRRKPQDAQFQQSPTIKQSLLDAQILILRETANMLDLDTISHYDRWAAQVGERIGVDKEIVEGIVTLEVRTTVGGYISQPPIADLRAYLEKMTGGLDRSETRSAALKIVRDTIARLEKKSRR